jgi:hypothetical protein
MAMCASASVLGHVRYVAVKSKITALRHFPTAESLTLTPNLRFPLSFVYYFLTIVCVFRVNYEECIFFGSVFLNEPFL